MYFVSAEAFDDRSGLRVHEPDLHRREAGLLRLRQQDPQHDRRRGVRGLCAARCRPGEGVTMAEPAAKPPQLHLEFRAATPCGAWRFAAGGGARRRGGGARRSAYRPAPSRHREADRAQDLPAGDPVFRPARLRRADEPGACVLPRGREAPRADGAAARAAHPRALLRDRTAALAPPQRHHAGDGRRRAHPAAVGFRGAREADGVLRARLGLAHARGLFPRRRRAPGPAAKADRRHRRVLRSVPRRSATISNGCSPATASSSSAMSTSAWCRSRTPGSGASPA